MVREGNAAGVTKKGCSVHSAVSRCRLTKLGDSLLKIAPGSFEQRLKLKKKPKQPLEKLATLLALSGTI
jgi:hypothetical protein